MAFCSLSSFGVSVARLPSVSVDRGNGAGGSLVSFPSASLRLSDSGRGGTHRVRKGELMGFPGRTQNVF